MSNSIDLGLDFGSIFFRAAYMLNQEVVPIPISRSKRTWSGTVFTAGLEARQPFLFESLKSELGLAGQSIRFGPGAVTVAERVEEWLARFKKQVEDYAGCPVGRVVIVVPGYYLEKQRIKIQQIAQVVGFQQVELLDDGQAAVLGYTTLAELEHSVDLLVFSMGFMGFEVNLIRLDQTTCQTIAGQGDLEPSGRDVDRLLMERCVAEARQRNAPLPFTDHFDQFAWMDLRDVIEEAKKQVGLGEAAQFTLPSSVTGNFSLPMLLQVADFEAVIQGYVHQTLATVHQVLAAGQTSPSQVDKVLLVGGTTRLPSFQAALTNLFGPKLIQPRDDLLARGAAIHAANSETNLTSPQPSTTPTPDQSKIVNPKSKIINPPTPEAILAYAQRLADNGDYGVANDYLSQILESIQLVQARLEMQEADKVLTKGEKS